MIRTLRATIRFRLLPFLIAPFFGGQVLFAQETNSASASAPLLLPPIIVTGKLPSDSQAFQDFSSQDIQDLNIQTPSDLIRQVPNAGVNAHYTFPGTTYTIRGVGEQILLINSDLRSAVAQYIDDIPSIDTLSRTTPLFNIASAQFYRGPQETYFGAPSPAGALNIYTVAPTNHWTANADYQYGSYDFQQVQTSVNAPLIKDQLYMGFAGNFSEQNGYITNPVDGSKINGYQKRDGLLRLIWKPNTNLEIGLYGGLGNFSQDNFFEDPPVSQLSNPYTLPTDFNGYNYQRYNTEALRVVWYGDGYKILSVTSRRGQSVNSLFNTSYILHALPLNVFDSGQDFETEAYTQELRVESQDSSSPLQWRCGFFFSDRSQNGDDLKSIYYLPLITGMPGTALEEVIDNTDEYDYAVYGQATWHATEQLDLTFGLRGEIFDEDSDSGLAVSNVAAALIGDNAHTEMRTGSLTQGTYMPSLQTTWHWNDSQFTWFKFDKAWRPGGVGIYQLSANKYTKETSWNFELGHKINLWQNRLSLTPILFYSFYQNYQSPFVVNPLVTYEANAKYASARGAELSVSFTPIPRLNFTSNLGYIDARYDEFPGEANNGVAIADIPLYTIDNDIDFRQPITKSTDLMLRIDYDITGTYYSLSTDPASRYKQGAYGLLSAKVGYEFPHGGIYFFGANLTDSHYLESVDFDPAIGYIGNPAAPPTLGVEISLNY